MQRKTRLRPDSLELEGDQNPEDRPGCDLLGCQQRCGRIQVQLVFGEGMYAIYCPHGWVRTVNYPEPGDDKTERTDFDRFQVFLRFVHSRAYVRAALLRAAGGESALD